MSRKGFAAFALMAVIGLAATGAAAQERPQSVRGQIVSVEPSQLVIETREGEQRTVTLPDDLRVFAATEASLADVQPGAYVGITSIEAQGRQVGLGAHIFSEEMRGLGEGQSPWDLIEEENTMTNATVATVAERSGENEVTLTFKQGEQQTPTEQTIFLPSDIPVMHFGPGTRDLIIPGAHVRISGQEQPDGTFAARGMVVGRDGVVPTN